MFNMLRLVLAFAMALVTLETSVAQKQGDDRALAINSARELLDVTGAAQQFDVVMPQMTRQMADIFIKQRPEHAAEIRDVFGLMLKRFIDKREALIDRIAELYADRLTVSDMQEVTGFYRSAAGARFVAAMPGLTSEAMKIGRTWGETIGREIAEEARRELKKRGIEL